MPTCPAKGCGFKAKTDRSLSLHLQKCKKAAAGLALVGEEVEQHDADYRQAKRRKVSSLEQLEVVPEAEDPGLEVRVTNNRSKTDISPAYVCLIRMTTNLLAWTPHLQLSHFLHFPLVDLPLQQVVMAVPADYPQCIKIWRSPHMRLGQVSPTCQATRHGSSRWKRQRWLRQRDVRNSPHQHPLIHQHPQFNSRGSELQKTSLGVLGFTTNILPQNSQIPPCQTTTTLLTLERLIGCLQGILLQDFRCLPHW